MMMMNVTSGQPRSRDDANTARRRAPWFPTHIDPQTTTSHALKSLISLHILLSRSERFERSLVKFEKGPTAAVAYRGGGFGGPPKFRSFEKVEPDCKLSGKYLVFLFQHSH